MEKYCPGCDRFKDSDEFGSDRSTPDGKCSSCKTCHNERARQYNKTHRLERRALTTKQQRVDRRWMNLARHAARRSRVNGVECDIDGEHVLEVFNSQNGLCYWLGVLMKPPIDPYKPAQPSIDRLDDSKGYVRGNIVISCRAANLGRGLTDQRVFRYFCEAITSSAMSKSRPSDPCRRTS